MKKLISLLLALALVLSILPAALAAPAEKGAEDIVILYTNDVHTYIDKPLSYDNIADMKTTLAAENAGVLLVDAGDHIQGTAFGSMDKGETIIELMNAAGYDLATLGNHEFDYGMERTLELVGKAEFPYVSANFYHELDGVKGETVLDAYKVFEIGGKKIALIGITTPESFTKSTPAYFQDENGNYIYGIGGGTDGAALYADVQAAIDAASAEADYVIALGHCGDDPASKPWTSEEVIANTTGLDAFIDGHSHSTIPGKEVTDKDGNNVLLTQTGEYFGAIGKMTIGAEGITTELVTEWTGSNADVAAIKTAWTEEVNTLLGEVIGSTELTLDNYDAEGNRMVRKYETNTGDFAADALYWLFDSMDMDVDVAIMNGGGVRNGAVTGEISYLTCKTIHTFGNVACLQTVTGQQVIDALEWGARQTPLAEVGGFLHVSGITYKVDSNVETSVQMDDKGVWIGGPTGEYRVHDVKVYDKETNTYVDIDPEAKYNLAGYNYTLRDLGDGFAMFDGAVNVLDYVSEDYQVLATYVKAFENGKVEATNSPLLAKYPGMLLDYGTVNGSGRIEVSEYEEVWDGVITIGGLEPNLWTTKYGNVYTDCSAEHFTEDLGLAWGDLATVKFLDKELVLPVVPDYSYVDSGKPALLLGKNELGNPTGYAFMAINMGNFLETYGIAYKGTDADGNWYWTAYEGVEFPIVVTFELYEKEGYMAEYLLHELHRTNNREDYPDLTDEEFANFREVTTTGMGDDTLYRSSSPINPELGRNTYADAAMEAAGIKTVINLADSETSAAAYPGFAETYYSQQRVLYLNLGVDFAAADFQEGLANGLRFMAANEGPYLVHCTEGKDRAGFVNALLECFMGATYEEVVADYMVTYYNYYGVEPGTDKYNAIADSNIVKSLKNAFGVEDLTTADLAAEAEEYLRTIGLGAQEVANLYVALGGEIAVSEDIVILYTNDVHTYIDKDLSYDTIADLKQALALENKAVLLIDAGDHIQGTAYGSMDKGATIIELMNAAGYDLATLGNHEFDYGMEGAMNVIEWADFPYVSANFYHEKDGVKGETVLDAYQIFEIDGVKIAIIGITTPESFTKSTPAYFQDENGNYIYGIGGGADGAELYADVQAAIDDAYVAGADYVIALGHLGDDPASQPWTSEELIANTTGLDAFIDGHSHSTVVGKEVADKEGNPVLLTQTGEYFDAIGKMTISAEGITTELISSYAGSDAEVAAIQNAWIDEIETKLGEVIGYAEVTFDNYVDGGRIVRKQETNTGDFAADALYYLFDNMGLDVDVAIMNGGGVRNKAITGEISYLTCKNIHTFGNVACLQTITGQQLLDALEWGARGTPDEEIGGFLHVSGITYEIHTYIPSTVQQDEKGVWIGGPTGEYRVKNVMVGGEPLDLEAKYNLAGYNYTLRDLGDGFAMFDGAVNVLDYVMEDYQVLANYVKSFEPDPEHDNLPTIQSDSIYAEVTGEGRITLITKDPNAPIYEELVLDSSIREEGGIPTYITLPADYDSENEYPVVFMIHGHGGNHNEWGGYDSISNGLAENGIIAVTLDFPGCGASEESFTLNTMTNMKQDVLDVIEYVTECYSVDETKIGGFGYSMGGRIILEMTAEELYAFDTIEFVAPAEDLEDLKNLFGGAENWEVLKAEANENGFVMYSTIYSTLPLSKEWFADLEKYPDGLKELAAEKYTGNSMVFWATDDAAVSPWVSEGVAETFNSATLNVYSYGHSYGFYADDPYVDRVTTDGSVGYFVHEFTCEEEGVHGYVKTVDEHGCLVLTVTAEDLAAADIELGDTLTVKFGGVWGTVTYAETVGEVGPFLVEEGGKLVVKDASIENLAEYLGFGSFEEGNWYYSEGVEIPMGVTIVEEPAFVNPFTDVPEDVWYTEYVLMMAEAGIIKGMTETTFEPETNLTRAQLVTMLYRLVGEPEVEGLTEPFTDVPDGLWYTDAVIFAYNTGIVKGVTETTFEPDAKITREQLVTILYRLAQAAGVDVSIGEETNILSYPDAEKVSPYAVEAIQWAVGAGILNGITYEGDKEIYLAPQGLATRAQAAKLIVTFVIYAEENSNPVIQ